MPEEEKERLTTNIANAMRSVAPEIQARQLDHFRQADPRYGDLVSAKLRK